MFPLAPAELGAQFALERVLRHGALPLVWASEEPAAVLDAYAQLYLREEIRAEGLVRNLPGFVRFLAVAAVLNGQVVNVAGIARDSGVARATVQGYLDILDDTLLTARLPAFEAKLRVRERKLPKLYWIDPGVVRAVKKQFGDVGAEERGALFECWVHTLLRTHAEQRALYDDMHYWSPHRADVEVDFLLRRGTEALAIEVKAAPRYHTGHLKGLRAIANCRAWRAACWSTPANGRFVPKTASTSGPPLGWPPPLPRGGCGLEPRSNGRIDEAYPANMLANSAPLAPFTRPLPTRARTSGSSTAASSSRRRWTSEAPSRVLTCSAKSVRCASSRSARKKGESSCVVPSRSPSVRPILRRVATVSSESFSSFKARCIAVAVQPGNAALAVRSSKQPAAPSTWIRKPGTLPLGRLGDRASGTSTHSSGKPQAS